MTKLILNFIKNHFGPVRRMYFGLVLFIYAVLHWGYSFFTNTTEPPLILSLSWGAVVFSSIVLVFESATAIEQEENKNVK